MEIVLGIDNVIFISILADKLPARQREAARRVGLSLAVGLRIVLLLLIGWIVGLQESLFHIGSLGISGRDLILFFGGLFLVLKTLSELRQKTAVPKPSALSAQAQAGHTFAGIVLQIIMIDLVFSFDSILTAVGLVDSVALMIVAVLVSAVLMVVTAKTVSEFVSRHPSVKILALSFLLLIGGFLMLEAVDITLAKGYLYFGMGFGLLNELLNMRYRKARALAEGQPLE